MIAYRTGIEEIAWEQLFELYAQVGLVAGLGHKRDEVGIRRAFEASAMVVTAWADDRLVGAGRMISDGVCVGTIFDVGVLPAYQKQGIGRGIMEKLMAGNEHLRMHLTSTFGNEAFYKKLGFKRHKTAFARYPAASDYLEE